MVKAGSCLNACGVGTGKSAMFLAACDELKTNKNLIVCPKSVVLQWKNELSRWIPDANGIVVSGNKAERLAIYDRLAKADKFYLITSYDLVRVDAEYIGKIKFETICCDEVHRLASTNTKRYKAIREISREALYRFGLSATPFVNVPPDLYGVFNWIKPGYLGRKGDFLNRYIVFNKWGGMLYPINKQELTQRIKHCMVRKSLEEVLPEMPAMTFEDVVFDLSEKERALYDKLRAELLFEVEKYLVNKLESPMIVQMTLTKMLVLSELTCSLELLGEDTTSTKLEVLKERLEDTLVNGNKAIIFSRFRKMTDILRRELQEYSPLLITGEITGEARDEAVKKFQNNDEYKLLISTDAGGEGLNLDRANIIFHYDLPWSYGKYVQRNGRIKRLTQKKPTIVYNLTAKKTIDTYIKKVLTSKEKLAGSLLGDPITMKDIKQILSYEQL